MSAGGDEKELRLALVCYGGSSLAIYMHGVTKEVNRLVLGSVLRQADGTRSGPPAGEPSGTQYVYAKVLDERAERDKGVETRVVVDIVAGTSAGGINGVYLSKALAHNLSQNGLRDLWFERGDVNQLLRGPSWIPWRLRLPVLLAQAGSRSPVRGDAMAQWLYRALEGMDDGGRDQAGIDSLLPERHLLELYVTVTDFYGYDRQVKITDPRTVSEGRHRHALAFRYESGGVDNFSRSWNGALAFGARTTSSFPGAFPAVSFEEFAKWVPSADLKPLADHSFRIHALSGADPKTAQFVDGGVLDNKPFGWAIDALTRRAADVEVERRLLYLEPDPGDAHRPGKPHPLEPRDPPSPIKAILAAISTLPSAEPILDDLLLVERHNERVERMQDVIRTSFEPVAGVLEQALGPLGELAADPDLKTLAGWNTTVHQRAIEEAGVAYATYLRLKISGAVDRYAETVCRVREFPADSNHAALVREAIRALARSLGLFDEQVKPSDAQLAFLRDFDLGFGERRLLFVVAALRRWYRDLREGKPDIPPRSDLDQGKQILYGAVDRLRRTMGGDDYPSELKHAVAVTFSDETVGTFIEDKSLDGEAYVSERGAELRQLVEQVAAFNRGQLHDFSVNLFLELDRVARDWPAARRRDLLVRYLGFPLWDVLLYPIQWHSGAGEADEVHVIRMSPFEAHVLKKPPAEKVQGVKWGHFWAFFDRAARENDYLWGRLDGAANLIGILLGKDHASYRAWCLQAFAAILDEEASSLPHIAAAVDALRAEIEAG